MSSEVIDAPVREIAPAPAPEPSRQLTTTPQQLLSLAVQQGASLDQLERFMALVERHEANEARKAFAEAFAEFKAQEVVRIYKDKSVDYAPRNGGRVEYDHASIGNVVKAIAEALGRHGFSHSWNTRQEKGVVYVTCTLRHRGGHHEEVTLSGEPDTSGTKNAIQAVGSVITYLQRYTLLAITGCATEDQPDDDGAGARPRQEPRRAQAAAAPAQAPAELLEQAEIAADSGVMFYAKWWGELTIQQRKQIGIERHGAFKARATKADEMAKAEEGAKS